MTIPPDKIAHYAFGITVGSLAILFGWYAMFLVLVLAVIKELWDYKHPPHTPEFLDIIATCIGGAIPMAIILLSKVI